MIATDAAEYNASTLISLRLTNRTGRTVGYNLCRARLERQTGDGWQEIRASLGDACTMELRGLRPGQSATFTFRTATQTPPGMYRVRTELHEQQGGATIEAVSTIFRIFGDSG